MSETETQQDARVTVDEYFAQQERKRQKEWNELLKEERTNEPEVIGAATYSSDETKTCSSCGDETPAQGWDSTGPTYRDRAGNKIQMAVLECCPSCGRMQ